MQYTGYSEIRNYNNIDFRIVADLTDDTGSYWFWIRYSTEYPIPDTAGYAEFLTQEWDGDVLTMHYKADNLKYNTTYYWIIEVRTENDLSYPIISSAEAGISTTPDPSRIINVDVKAKEHKAYLIVEVEILTQDNYNVTVEYQRKRGSQVIKHGVLDSTTTNGNRKTYYFKLIGLSAGIDYKYKVTLNNLTYNQTADYFESEFKTLKGWKLWEYLWYRL